MAMNAPFKAILADAGQPEAVAEQLTGKLNGLWDLITRHNSRVVAIQQTKAHDPNNAETLDVTWKNEPSLSAEAAEFHAVAEQYETMLAALREKAKSFIKPPLSDAEATAERTAANEEAKLIEADRPAAEALAALADTMLNAVGKGIPDGLFSLMPEVQSIKNTRGRKAASGNDGTPIYRTRLDLVKLDGVAVERTRTKAGVEIKESNFVIAAEDLNAKWNAEKFPGNTVTDEELERAMYASVGNDFRDKEGMPQVVTFDFTREIEVQNPNDDNTTKLPQTVKVEATRNVKVSGAAAEKVAAKQAEENKSADDKPAETAKTEEPKSDATTETSKTETAPANGAAAPNQKAAALAAKQAPKAK